MDRELKEKVREYVGNDKDLAETMADYVGLSKDSFSRYLREDGRAIAAEKEDLLRKHPCLPQKKGNRKKGNEKKSDKKESSIVRTTRPEADRILEMIQRKRGYKYQADATLVAARYIEDMLLTYGFNDIDFEPYERGVEFEEGKPDD